MDHPAQGREPRGLRRHRYRSNLEQARPATRATPPSISESFAEKVVASRLWRRRPKDGREKKDEGGKGGVKAAATKELDEPGGEAAGSSGNAIRKNEGKEPKGGEGKANDGGGDEDAEREPPPLQISTSSAGTDGPSPSPSPVLATGNRQL